MEVSKLLEFICNSCNTYFNYAETKCPNCQTTFIFNGNEKNITDSLSPNCLVHRYQGSDLLEIAMVLKEGKTNMKIAITLKDLLKPITVPKSEVFKVDKKILSAITKLRAQRKARMEKYDEDIAAYWNKLQIYASQ